MRKWAILLVLARIAWPVFGEMPPAVPQPVTVQQLEQAIANAHHEHGRRLARQISNMRLTTRLSADRLAHLEAELHSTRARAALIAIADESIFLDPPASEIPAKPAPSAAEQAAMLRLSVDAVKKTIASLPNFIAMRQTTRFEGTATVLPADLQDALFADDFQRAPPGANWECPGEAKIGYQRISVIDRSSVTVVNRNGQELHSLGERGGEFECPKNAVSTTEEFGKVLEWVPRIVAHANVTWSHWEKGTAGCVAVFHYSVLVSHRSIPVDIQGEITLDPKDGSVLRLTEVRRWTKHEAVSGDRPAYDVTPEYDSAVDYGPVTLAGVVYLCPIKRVAIYRAPILRPQGVDSQHDAIYRRFKLTESPLQEFLNDVTFTQYRLYGSS